jgi:hypothetical protein
MKLKQLSLFLENKPGALTRPCQLLAKAKTQQFGILRLVIRDWEKAKQVLEKGGCVVKITDVVAIEVPDRPGGLVEILTALEQAKINVEYMYAFTLKNENRGVLVFRFDDPDKAIALLQKKTINVLDSVELYERLEAGK